MVDLFFFLVMVLKGFLRIYTFPITNRLTGSVISVKSMAEFDCPSFRWLRDPWDGEYLRRFTIHMPFDENP